MDEREIVPRGLNRLQELEPVRRSPGGAGAIRTGREALGDQAVLRGRPDVAGQRDFVARRVEDFHTTAGRTSGSAGRGMVVCCASGCSAIATASAISPTK